MSFVWPQALLSLVLVPLLVAIYLRVLRRRQQTLMDLGPMGRIEGSQQGRTPNRRHLPPAIMLFGLSLLLVAAARPQAMVSLPHVEGTVILAFDVSGSMQADDLEPTRLEAAQAAARAFVEHQPPAIRLGAVAFSGGGLVVQRPTDDRQAVLDTIDRLSPEGATSLGEGIFTALNALSDQPLELDQAALEQGQLDFHLEDYSSAVVLLLTDGENTEQPDPLVVAQLAAEAGVRIYPIGIGSTEGAVLELDGFEILSQLDETVLQQIADTTNGKYFRADDARSLQDIYQDIDLQMTVRGDSMEITSIVAGLSLLVLLVGGALALLWFGRIP